MSRRQAATAGCVLRVRAGDRVTSAATAVAITP
jgi:hypothetical protein